MVRVGNRKIQLIILLVLVSLVGTMSIAYAVLSATLNINGTAQVQSASWDVHFSNVQVNRNSVDINPIIADKNKVSFSAHLTTPGDFYEFTVDIVNAGTIDAMIESIIKTPDLTEEQKKYLKYEVEYVNGEKIEVSQLLMSKETKTISVLFEYRNDISISDLPTTEVELDLEIDLVYRQADNIDDGITPPVIKLVSGDLNTVGSEICISDECFYLIKSDGCNLTLFSKYNLYVGGQSNASGNFTAYDESATGKQDASMLGWVEGINMWNGTTAFSTVDEHGTKYNSYEGSLVEKYVIQYENYLKTFNINLNKVRLITKEELESLGCDSTKSSCSDAFSGLLNTSFWTGTAYENDYIWFLVSDGNFSNYIKYDRNDRFGVRPVVEIVISY